MNNIARSFDDNYDLQVGRLFGPVTIPAIDRGYLLEPPRAVAAFAARPGPLNSLPRRKPRNETLANLSALPDNAIAALRLALKGVRDISQR